MRKLGILGFVIAVGISLASISASGSTRESQTTVLGTPARIVTKKELVHANTIRIPKPKLFRSNPFRKSFFLNYKLDYDDDIFVQDEDLHTKRRRDLQELKKQDIDLPERIRWRLFLSRQLALMKYREIHG